MIKIDSKKLDRLQDNIGYKFKDKNLLIMALTHSSYANENNMSILENNERLEFLGDSVINLIASQYLYKKYPEYPEGELTKLRAMLVCELALAFAARKIGLGEYLLLGKGEDNTGGRKRDSILADGLEALTGSVYIDSDFERTEHMILEKFIKDIEYISKKDGLFIDYKTSLQEELQKKPGSIIKYEVFKEEGPDHDKVFHVEVLLNDKRIGTGQGKNKKDAEQKAAKKAFEKMRVKDE